MAKHQDGSGPLTWIAVIFTTCILLFLFQKILWLVVPFMLAFVLYYLISPFTHKLIMAGLSPELAAIGLSGIFLLLAGAWLLVLYPLAIAHAGLWQDDLQRYLLGGTAALEAAVTTLKFKFAFLRNMDMGGDYRQNLLDLSSHFSEKYLGQMITTIAAWLPSLLLAPIITFFLLRDGVRLRKFIISAVPNAYFEKTLYLMRAIDRTARMYFLGLLSLVAIDGSMLCGGLWALGIPAALTLGLLAALLGVIPYLGPLLGCAIALMVTATDLPGNPAMLYWVIGLFALVRVMDDFVFLPYVMGRSMHIHPLLTLLMFFIGEAIAGVSGLILVIPVLGIMMVIGETVEAILSDDRLRVRHTHARRLERVIATGDLTLD